MAEEFKFPDEVKATADATDEKLDITIEGEDGSEVEVVDDTPEADRGRKPLAAEPDEPSEEELAAYSDKVQKRIKELAHARHDERRSKEAVQREAEEVRRVAQVLLNENKQLKQRVNNGETVYAGTLTQSAEAKLEIAKKKYKEAHEAYDADAMLEAQQSLTQAQWELASAKNFRPTPLQADPEPVYNALTGQEPPRPDEKTLRWQQRNQWFGQDDEMTALALIQHKKLVASGVDPRSDEYFSQIDTRMKQRFPEFYGVKPQRSEARRPTSVVASASRSSGTKKVTLTQTQVALAKKFGLTNEQYAASVVQMENTDGR